MNKRSKSKCPITGLSIITHPDWTNISFESNHLITFKIINNNILFVESKGVVTIHSLKGTLSLSEKIIKENFGNNPFIYMENLEKVSSISVAGRKYYINFLQKLKNLKMLIYFNASPFLRLSIKLAKKINFFSFQVHAVKTYSEAIDLSLKSLNTNTDNSEITEKKWDIQFEEYSVRFQVINDNICHIESQGILGLHHINKVIEFQNNFIKKKLKNKKGEYYLLLNFNNVSITRECRMVYAKKIQSLFHEFPFKHYVYFGASRLLEIVVAFSTRFISFKVKKTSNFQSGLDFIQKDMEKNENQKSENQKSEMQKHIDEFIVFLSQVDWEKEGFDKSFNKDISHPFYKIYDAITLIKSDLDELYLERKQNKEEKAILQYKLQQSLKLETMGKLAGSVAHDLNNVLSGIVSYPDIILNTLPQKKENEKAIKYIKRMQISGQKAAEIVQDLLTLSRRGVVNFESINLNTVINQYLKSPELKKLQQTNPQVSIKCNLAEDLFNISASPIHLSKAVMNLVTNAVEAIQGKGNVLVTTKNKKFKNETIATYEKKADGKYIELIVSDTGSGISKQDQPKIFEPFYSKKVMGSSGTGLGMMVIKGTVDDHNGFIIIKSEENKGTDFILYFPVKDQNSTNKIVKKINNFTGKGESILIVDDDEDQRIIAKEILQGLYYSAKTCSSGEESIEYLKSNSVDLVIIDMIMAPGIGGLETYKQILKLNSKQKAIIVSGYSASNDVELVQKLGAGKYIRKPYTTEEIGVAVYEELNKKE